MASKEQIMTAIYDMDPSTSTIATAWSSCDLGDPQTEPTEFWAALDADDAADPKPASVARRVGFVAALAGVFGLGAAFGLAVFDVADWTPPTIALPYVSTQGGQTSGPIELGPPAPASDIAPKPVGSTGNVEEPTPTVSSPDGAAASGVAPTSDSKPGPVTIASLPANTPGGGGGQVTVDVAIPAPPEAVPVPDEPEPKPKPKTPKPTLQLAPGTDSTTLQPVQPPTLKKPRTTLYDPSSPGSKPKFNPSTKPSQRTTLSKP
jgi:hypothetical protein